MKPVWEREPPKGHKPESLTRREIARAKASARAKGETYPSLVANMRQLQKRKG